MECTSGAAEHVAGKSIVVTGAASGFGRLVTLKAAQLGARVTCGDVDEAGLAAVLAEVTAAGGSAQALRTDVARVEEMRALVQTACDVYGALDVMVNNAGIMPLAFFSDSAVACEAWDRCIDINFKGVLNGMIVAHEAMMARGRGHIVNVSSIYGNFPVAGASVYGATKAAVKYLSESLRLEARGKIKVTTVKPTGVAATGLAGTMINSAAHVGITAHNTEEFRAVIAAMKAGSLPPERLDPDEIDYAILAPDFIADAIIYAINQPWGVSIADITVRAAGDYFVL